MDSSPESSPLLKDKGKDYSSTVKDHSTASTVKDHSTASTVEDYSSNGTVKDYSSNGTVKEQYISTGKEEEVIKVYWRRWLVLFVFVSHLIGTNMAWVTVSSIADVAECYYDVNVFWINSLNYIFLIMYTLLFWFATWFLQHFGLKWAAIIGGTFNAIGAWLRFAATGPQYFWLLLIGQGISSITNLIEWSAPSLVSAVWFPPNERALATASVGATAPQVGILISLFLGPIIVQSPNTDVICNTSLTQRDSLQYNEWSNTIYWQLLYYQLGQAIFATLLLPVTFMVTNSPPTPPSKSRQLEEQTNAVKESLGKSLYRLCTNVYFIFFTIVFGIYLGASGTYVTMYDEIFNAFGYQDYQHDMGYLGLAIQLSSIIGLLSIGFWLDYTKTFYLSIVSVTVLSSIMVVGLGFAAQYKINFLFFSIILSLTIGIINTFQGVAYEYGVEMTYPVPESISASILNVSSQVLCTAMILGCSEMVKKGLALYVFWTLGGFIVIATILQIFIKPKFRRVEIDNSKKSNINNKLPVNSIQ